MAANGGGTAGDAPATQQNQQQTWGQMLKGLLFQMLIIYFITSFFRGGNKQAQTEDGKPVVAARNLFPNDQKMVFLNQELMSLDANFLCSTASLHVPDTVRSLQLDRGLRQTDLERGPKVRQLG